MQDLPTYNIADDPANVDEVIQEQVADTNVTVKIDIPGNISKKSVLTVARKIPFVRTRNFDPHKKTSWAIFMINLVML